jgi:hypothetical protein
MTSIAATSERTGPSRRSETTQAAKPLRGPPVTVVVTCSADPTSHTPEPHRSGNIHASGPHERHPSVTRRPQMRSSTICTLRLPGTRPRGDRTGRSALSGRAQTSRHSPRIFGRETVDSASGPACAVLRGCKRRVGSLGPGLTFEPADARSGCPC